MTSARPRRWPLIAGAVMALAAAAGAGWWFASQPLTPAAPAGAVASSGAGTAAAPSPNAPATDEFLSPAQTMTVRTETAVRDFPSFSGGGQLALLPAGASVTGRLVRGADHNSRWLRLANGGYVTARDLAAAPRVGPPIRIAISNQGCQWGPDLEPYFDRSIAAREALAARSPDGIAPEDASSFIAVPNRTWNGLTVSAVAVHWESAAVYFREPVDQVRRVLRENGIEVSDLGEMPIRNEESVEAQSLDPTNPEDRRYGASSITCGV